MHTASIFRRIPPSTGHLSRRSLLSGIAALFAARFTRADTLLASTSAVDADHAVLTRLRANVSGAHPAVVLLHGSRGVELNPQAYQHHADILLAKGLDVYLLRYLDANDKQALDPSRTTAQTRDAYSAARFDVWSQRVSRAIDTVLTAPDGNGRVGLLGFSLGGYLAAMTAAKDRRVDALTVFYGGMPMAMAARAKHLPPTLVLHGEDDHVVPTSEGRSLVALARRLGATADIVTYPGKDHGFDLATHDTAGDDAMARATTFLYQALQMG